MSIYPKEFGPRSPQALAKLKTAVATTPGVHSVSVHVPGALGQKSGAFQRVVTDVPEVEEKQGVALYGVTGKSGAQALARPYLGTNLRGKVFQLPKWDTWTGHAVKGLYWGTDSAIRSTRTYALTYDIPDGMGAGGMTPNGMTVSIHVTLFGDTLWLGTGPRYKQAETAALPTPIDETGHMASITLFADRNANGANMQQYEDGRLYFASGLAGSRCAVVDPQGKYRIVSLRGTEGARDAWNLPKNAYESVSVKLDKPNQKGVKTVPSTVHPFKPPVIEGAGSSHVHISELVPLGGGRVGCMVGVQPFARRTMGNYNPGEIALHIGKEHDTIATWESLIEFKNSKGALYFAVTEDYGASWKFQPLTKVFDTPVPAWEGYKANAGLDADYVTEQPLLGRALYRADGWDDYDPVTHLYTKYDILFPAPDRAGAWNSKCVARVATAVHMSHAFALSEDIWMLVVPMLDDRIYNNTAQDYVRWRCLALRTDNRGGTWHEVTTPFSDKAESYPKDTDRGYAVRATPLRDGVALLKFYKAYRRAGDPPAVRDEPRKVRFALTTDYGASWTEVYPVGLPSLNPTMLGSLMVVRAKRTTSVVAMTVWDALLSAYWVYSSKDDGMTWERGAKVVDGSFVAMDEVPTIDGSGTPLPQNLAFLTPLLDDTGRPANVDAGAPWLRDATKKKPKGPE